jgi:hypothetical protein
MELKEQTRCSFNPSAELVSANELQKSGHGNKNITLRREEAPLRKSGLVYFEA